METEEPVLEETSEAEIKTLDAAEFVFSGDDADSVARTTEEVSTGPLFNEDVSAERISGFKVEDGRDEAVRGVVFSDGCGVSSVF